MVESVEDLADKVQPGRTGREYSAQTCSAIPPDVAISEFGNTARLVSTEAQLRQAGARGLHGDGLTWVVAFGDITFR